MDKEVRVVPNRIDPTQVDRAAPSDLPAKLGLESKFVLLFGGVMG
jgi:hypothetical protein